MTTEMGRKLAARAKREAWGNWEGIVQFDLPAIEAEARASERKLIVERIRERLGPRHDEATHRIDYDRYCMDCGGEDMHALLDEVAESDR